MSKRLRSFCGGVISLKQYNLCTSYMYFYTPTFIYHLRLYIIEVFTGFIVISKTIECRNLKCRKT